MSGSGARSIFYIGFMEVLLEQNIPIYAIAAQSGASFIAASIACGTFESFKKDALNLNWKRLRKLFSFSSSGLGIFSLEKAENYISETVTLGQHFDQVPLKLCFPVTDLTSGQLVPLAYGDLAKAIITTCSVPGLFEPILWGNQLLVDGGLLSTIPVKAVEDFGCDAILSVSVRGTDHVFPAFMLHTRLAYNYLKRNYFRSLIPRRKFATTLGVKIPVGEVPETEPEDAFGMSRIFFKSLDLALEAKNSKEYSAKGGTPWLKVMQGDGKYVDSLILSQNNDLYSQGRQAALENLVSIKELVYG